MNKKILFILLLAVVQLLQAQTPNDEAAKRAMQVGHTMQQERIFMHFDNSAYYLGETMWFKAYVSYGTNDRVTTPSKVMYVELVAPEGYVVETKKYKIDDNGCCNGEFELNPLLLSGYYEVRAYTRYMLNWGEEAVFSRVFPVFDKVNGDNWDFKNMLDRKRGFQHNGEWISEELPEADLKFYPEGGHLVAGLTSNVAYEIRGLEGDFANEEITILANNAPIAKTRPTHYGKGTFTITPQTGVKYTAKVTAQNKKGKREEFKFELPEVKPYGVTLHAKEERGEINFTVQSNREENEEIAFGIMYRGALGFYKKIPANEKSKTFTIGNEELPEGVNKAIVFCGETPLAERCLFVTHDTVQKSDKSTAKLVVKSNGEPLSELNIGPYEKITLDIEREDGKPIPSTADLSIAVGDAMGYVKTSWNYNLYTYLLLGSEIKGYIPEAGQYFDKKNDKRKEQLDLVMLTNGWTAYDWGKLTQTSIKEMQPIERGITLKGMFFRKNRVSFKAGAGHSMDLLPQKENLIRFDIAYNDEAITTNTFRTDSTGEFFIETKDFYGKRIASLQPQVALKQNNNIKYAFALDRYFSPAFRLYDFWERNIGVPATEESVKSDSMIQLTPFDFLLSAVEVVSDAKKEAKSRPPHSEMRFDYLDEWEYAQDVTYLRDFNTYKDNVYAEALNEIKSEINQYNDSQEIDADKRSISEYDNKAGVLCVKNNLPHDAIKYVGYMRYGPESDTTLNHSPMFPVKEEYTHSITPADVVSSAIKRHNYNWAYWVQLMVVLGEYDSNKTPQPDYEYLRGDADAEKMTNFKEFVIRSDIKTRQQFENTLNYWAGKGRALDNKTPAQKFYMGFLSQHYVATQQGVDGFPSGSTFMHELTYSIETGSSDPKHPNYVACFIPYTEQDKRTGIIPDLANSYGVMRYTSIQGYNESKQFYSPDYSNLKPTNNKDYRRTLLWNPQIPSTGDGKVQIEFFNSSNCNTINVDIAGRDGQTIYSNDNIIITRINNESKQQTTRNSEQETKEESDEDFMYTAMEPEVEKACAKQHEKALIYYNQKRYKNAIVLWAELAKYKYHPALNYIALCYKKGTGLKPNMEQAMRFYEDAARNGSPEGQYELSVMYREGTAGTQSDSLAHVWLRRAVLQKEPRALVTMAKEQISKGEHDKAKELMQEASKSDNAIALYEYARYIEEYPTESGVTDKESIMRHMRKAAEKGYREAQIYAMEHEYSAQNYTEAYRWAKELSMAKCHEGTKRMADCYYNGYGVKRDKSLAKDLYRTAATGGNKEAEKILKEL